MQGRTAKEVVCVLLALSQLGCRSVYQFRCTSNPSEAGVVVREQMLGETPCSIKIPKDSDLIQDGKIEFTFCLPDGRERKRIVDIHDLKPTNPTALVVSMPFLLTGIGLLWLAGVDKDDEDSSPADSAGSKDTGGRVGSALLGLGALGLGAAVYFLLGGNTDSLSDYPVRVDFNEPQDGSEGVEGKDECSESH
jgi:hypothetical protein